MQVLLRSSLRELVEIRDRPCLSIFAPMVEAGPETRQNRTRFKNLVTEAEDRLRDAGVDPEDRRLLLEPARRRLEDSLYWQHQNTGLAFFRSPNLTQEHRLPLQCEDLVVVSDHFHVKPVLPLLEGNGRFFVLALSKGEVRLFEASRDTIAQIHLQDMPRSLADVLEQYEVPEVTLERHFQAAGARVPTAVHGKGVDTDLEKKRILEYFRRIDRALQDVLRDSNAPLVLAGVEYLLPIYEEANTYPVLLDEFVEGNPDAKKKSPGQIHKEAWKIVEPHFKRSQEAALDLLGQAAGTPRGSTRLKDILDGAHDGRVANLFLASGQQAWGRYEAASRQLVLHESAEAGDDELLNLAALQAYATGAMVFTVERDRLPNSTQIAAIFRY